MKIVDILLSKIFLVLLAVFLFMMVTFGVEERIDNKTVFHESAVEKTITDPVTNDQNAFELKPQETNSFMQKSDESFYIKDVTNFLQNTHVIAYYGHPNSKKMGILGRYQIEILAEKLELTTRKYDELNASNQAISAFYIILGTCQPGGEIGILKRSTVEKYIEFARQKGFMVFLDHQIGKYSVHQAMTKLLPYLKYPNVHLALDPEWRTLRPMKVIGSISAQELNDAQKLMKQYIEKNGISGNRMLVVHQFNHVMIRNRKMVRTDYDPVIVIHTQDGFGPPEMKKGTYQYNALATNMPVKGFKLFYKSGYKGAGFDQPLMQPGEVLSLNPKPTLIIYQ